MHHGLGDFKITNQQNKTKKQPLIGNHEFEILFCFFAMWTIFAKLFKLI
jgi:hypothetical protein